MALNPLLGRNARSKDNPAMALDGVMAQWAITPSRPGDMTQRISNEAPTIRLQPTRTADRFRPDLISDRRQAAWLHSHLADRIVGGPSSGHRWPEPRPQ